MKNGDAHFNESVSETIHDKERLKSVTKQESDVEHRWRRNITFEATHREDGFGGFIG